MINLAPVVAAIVAALYGCIPHVATHYSASFEGGTLYCGRDIYGTYNPADVSTVAVAAGSDYECGDRLLIIGSEGIVIGVVKDRCGGCGYRHLDLSIAGMIEVCGAAGVCDIMVRKISSWDQQPFEWRLAGW